MSSLLSLELFDQLSHPDLILWMIETDQGRLLRSNVTGKSIWGNQIDLLADDPEVWKQLIHPDDWPRVQTHRQQPESTCSFRMLAPQGEVLWVTEQVTIPAGGDPKTRLCVTTICRQVVEDDLSAVCLYQSIFEQLPVSLLLKDLNGRRIYANQNYLDLRNLTAEQIVGKTDRELYDTDFARECEANDKHVISTGTVLQDCQIVVDRKGQRRHIERIRTPICTRDGRTIGTQLICWDATSLHQAEDKAARELSLLHALLSNIPDSIYFKDRDSRFLRINKSMAEKFGLKSPEDAVGKTDRDFFTTEHAEQALADEQQIMATGQPVVAQVERETWPDRSDTWCSTTKMPLRSTSGEIIGTFGISRDITDLVTAEKTLEREQHLSDALMNGLPDLIFFKDRQGKFMKGNQALADYYGMAHPEELVGKTDYDFSPPELAASFEEDDQRVMKSGDKLIAREEVNEDSHGNITYFLTTKVPIRNSHGNVVGLVGIGRDITSIKRAQLEMTKARDLADQANRAKSDFLANMSHEIRTPMNAVIGMAELLEDTPLNETQREYLRMVRESGEVLLELINDILDFSKIEAGKFTIDQHPFDLHETIGDTMKSIAVRAHRRHLELAFHIAPDVPRCVEGDAGRLRQILVNLVGNAIKFTEVGEVVVDVSAEDQDETVLVTFVVRDTGIGISKDKQKLIFEAFEQADSSTTRRFGGTGLGLAITSRLVQMMGGTISVKSEVNRGSTFTFTVEFHTSDDLDPKRPFTAPEQMLDLPVLIVDDNTTNRQIVDEMLRLRGMKPSIASSAAEAFWMIVDAQKTNRPFQLVLTDVNMPDVDGFMLIERIRESADLTQPKIIVLTSGDRPGDVVRCAELNVSAHLLKPVKQSELIDAMIRAYGIEPRTITRPASDHDIPIRAGLKILVAEDAYANQVLARGLLEKWGHQVEIACNGREAIRLLELEKFDVILMDVQMPEMDGLTATKLIRERQAGGAYPHLDRNPMPIVAMTAHALKGDRERCLAAGMDAYVSKPIRTKDLQEVLAGYQPDAISKSGLPGAGNTPAFTQFDWEV
ncbi:MAG: PAS domain-containing protein, partial [Planctomycetaceae bacterium]|nr:PAS domain-containing protein [Planctomycetaceae bacterium]